MPRLRTIVFVALCTAALAVVVAGARVARGVQRVNDTAATFEALTPTLERLEAGNVQDLGAFRATLEDASTQISRARADLAPAFVLAPGIEWVPRLGPIARDGDTLLRASQDIVTAALDLLDLADTLAAAAEAEGPLGAEKINDTALRRLTEQRHVIVSSANRLKRAREDLEAAQGDLPPRYRRLAATTIRRALVLEGMAGTALALSDEWPELLGYHGPRTYLLVAQNRDELRATGGFVPGAWTITLHDGRFVDRQFWDTVAVDNFQANPPLPPEGLLESLWAGAWLFRDSTWYPDFPSTAAAMEQMFLLGPGVSVDGTIALNQGALETVLPALGPVHLPDGSPLEPESFMQVLEERTDVGGREYLDRVLEGLLAALEAPRPAERNMALLAGMHAALDRRDILLSFHHHGLKAMAAANAWDGALHQGPVDYLMVVDSNVGFSKVNRNIESEITYQVDLSRMDAPHARLDITYRNRSPGKQPPTCQVQSADASGQTYEELKSACYWDYLRVYTPKGARLEAASPMPMPDGALYRRIGYDDREETLRTYQEGDKEVVAGFFTVEIGETRTLALAYVLPSYVVSNGPTGATYTLYLQRQPGASAVPVQLVLRLPSGFRAMSHDLDWETVGGMATAATVLTKDLKVITHLVPADA